MFQKIGLIRQCHYERINITANTGLGLLYLSGLLFTCTFSIILEMLNVKRRLTASPVEMPYLENQQINLLRH